YWLMISIAGFIALYQLLFKPHYWEKTVHGLHLNKKLSKKKQRVIAFEVAKLNISPFDLPKKALQRIQTFISKDKFASGGMFIIANAIASVFTFIFSAYLGRKL